MARKNRTFSPSERVKASFVVKRETGDFRELTLARVNADVRPDLTDERRFRKALETALTQWVAETPFGKRAWAETSRDFNVGDLAHFLPLEPHDPLFLRLRAQGIDDLMIETISENDLCDHWMYDTLLVDESTLPGDDEAEELEDDKRT